MIKPIRVLIVDDSALVRRILTGTLKDEPDIEVVGAAPDPYVAREMILELKPDVLTLDIEMPRLDGVSFLKKLMAQHPLPVIMISSLAESSARVVMDALEAGAVEVLAKPAGPASVGALRFSLAHKVRAAAVARLRTPAGISLAQSPRAKTACAGGPPLPLIAIGASTGGTEAIREVLETMGPDSPPILIVQHIPAGFSKAFADRMDRLTPLHVTEAKDGDPVEAGSVLVAPGDFHMTLQRGSPMRVCVKSGPLVWYQRPSVDVLFQSVSDVLGKRSIGVLLTGMGADGAEGLLSMKQAGATTIAQDEASCVVYGMPKEAVRIGAACRQLPLKKIAPALMELASRPPAPEQTPRSASPWSGVR
jgi:two-component system chemotaxis response regulator CheB